MWVILSLVGILTNIFCSVATKTHTGWIACNDYTLLTDWIACNNCDPAWQKGSSVLMQFLKMTSVWRVTILISYTQTTVLERALSKALSYN